MTSRLRDLRLVRCVACLSLSPTRVHAALGWSTLIVTDMAIGRIRSLLVTRHVIGWGFGNHSRRVFGVTGQTGALQALSLVGGVVHLLHGIFMVRDLSGICEMQVRV